MANQNNSKMQFQLNSNSEVFNEKQKNLFAILENAEKSAKRNAEPERQMEVDTPNIHKQQKVMTKNFKSKESIFKRPEAPITRCLPSTYSRNPTKWTKYTLKDVKDDDISNRSNTRTALSFLRELEKRNSNNDDKKLDELPEKITFKKASRIKFSDDTKSDMDKDISFKSSKVVMPEYVVGQKVKKNKTNKKLQAETSKNNLKLDHLLQEEDEDE